MAVGAALAIGDAFRQTWYLKEESSSIVAQNVSKQTQKWDISDQSKQSGESSSSVYVGIREDRGPSISVIMDSSGSFIEVNTQHELAALQHLHSAHDHFIFKIF